MCTSGSTRESGHTVANTLAAGSGLATQAASPAIDERIRASDHTSVTMRAVTRRSPAGQRSTSTCAPTTLPGNLTPKRVSKPFHLSHDLTLTVLEPSFKAKKKRRMENMEELDELEQNTDPLAPLLNSEEPGYASGHDTDIVADPLRGLGLGGAEEEEDEDEDELIHDTTNNDLPPITTLRDPPTSTDNTSEASSPLPEQLPSGPPPPPIQVEDDLFIVPLRARKVPLSAKRKR